jgi:hypothetical protein
MEELIRKRKSGDFIYGWLCQLPNRTFNVPDKKTVRAFVQTKIEKIFKSVDDKLEIDERLEKTSLELEDLFKSIRAGGEDSNRSLNLLNNAISVLLERTMIVRKLNANMADPKYERVITDNMGTVKDLVDSREKLVSKFAASEAIAREIIERWVLEFAPSVRVAFEQVVGNDPAKTKKFLDLVKEESSKIDFARIKRESADKINSQLKETSNVNSKALRVNPV